MAFEVLDRQVLGSLLFIVLGISVQNTLAQTENFQEITVQGTVVDATDEEALADVTVLLLELNQQTQTDSDGQFSFKSIPEGEMMDGTLHIDHEGYEELSTTVRLDQNQRITLELTPKSETE